MKSQFSRIIPGRPQSSATFASWASGTPIDKQIGATRSIGKRKTGDLKGKDLEAILRVKQRSRK